jgi:hypothetical protein
LLLRVGTLAFGPLSEAEMSDQGSRKWHEIINEAPATALPFYALYEEYAAALKEREQQKKASPYWPYPRS